MECLDFSKLSNQLIYSQCEGVITLLAKPEKDKLFVSNYRKIRLPNCNYKTISYVVINRIDPFLNDLIQKERNDFMKARIIGDNVGLLFDVIDYVNYKKDARRCIICGFTRSV